MRSVQVGDDLSGKKIYLVIYTGSLDSYYFRLYTTNGGIVSTRQDSLLSIIDVNGNFLVDDIQNEISYTLPDDFGVVTKIVEDTEGNIISGIRILEDGESLMNVEYEPIGYPKITEVKAIVSCKHPFLNTSCNEEGWQQDTNGSQYKIYSANTTETVEFGTYDQVYGTEYENFNVSIVIDQIGKKNPKEIVVGFCGSKCGHPIYTKDEVDAKCVFKNKDLVEQSMTFDIVNGDLLINEMYIYFRYPEGFNSNNCYVIAQKHGLLTDEYFTNNCVYHTSGNLAADKVLVEYRADEIKIICKCPSTYKVGDMFRIKILMTKVE